MCHSVLDDAARCRQTSFRDVEDIAVHDDDGRRDSHWSEEPLSVRFQTAGGFEDESDRWINKHSFKRGIISNTLSDKYSYK